jgi:nicotinate-nucleotide adenylyltransferase
MNTQRIGILGGTFDPLHYGHLAIAEEAAWFLRLSHVYMVPAARQPLKHAPQRANGQQRLEMVRLACADNPLLVPSDIEIRRPPPSYTVETLRLMRADAGPDADLWFILGADALMQFHHWHAAAEIISLARLAAIARPGANIDLHALDTTLPGLSVRTAVLEGPHLDISSSEMRERFAVGRPVRYQMPDVVLDYIDTHGLYRDPPPAAEQ